MHVIRLFGFNDPTGRPLRLRCTCSNSRFGSGSGSWSNSCFLCVMIRAGRKPAPRIFEFAFVVCTYLVHGKHGLAIIVCD